MEDNNDILELKEQLAALQARLDREVELKDETIRKALDHSIARFRSLGNKGFYMCLFSTVIVLIILYVQKVSVPLFICTLVFMALNLYISYILKEKYNVSAEVIDARSLVPFNYAKVIESVKKTGRIVITGDACERNSFMRTFASNITELAFDYLDAPPVVVGSKNWITPAHELENCFFPQPEWIVDAIHERIMPLPGHVCTHNCTELEQIRENAAGI